MERLHLFLPFGQQTEVLVGKDIFHHIRDYVSGRIVAIIADSNVSSLYGRDVERMLGTSNSVYLFTFPPGERSKTRRTKERIEDKMLEKGIGRDGLVVGLGGGVATDIAGFVSATYMRGLDFIAIPTSLLGAVDAAIGGKNGVNTKLGKNLIGSFHHPKVVIVDCLCMRTLSQRQVINGLAEMVKHAIIADAEYLEAIVNAFPEIKKINTEVLVPLVKRSIEIKGKIITSDAYEKGMRQHLNFGHTIGHAIERCLSYRIAHGYAVAIGISVESEIAYLIGILSKEERDKIREALHSLCLPVALPERVSAEQIIQATRLDKKGRGGIPRYALPLSVGKMAKDSDGEWTFQVEDSIVIQAIREVQACSVSQGRKETSLN